MGHRASIKTGFSTFNFGGCVIPTSLALYECCGSRRRARLRVYSINVMRALHRAWFREDLADRFRSDEGWAKPKEARARPMRPGSNFESRFQKKRKSKSPT